jgi:hypothetical protein
MTPAIFMVMVRSRFHDAVTRRVTRDETVERTRRGAFAEERAVPVSDSEMAADVSGGAIAPWIPYRALE